MKQKCVCVCMCVRGGLGVLFLLCTVFVGSAGWSQNKHYCTSSRQSVRGNSICPGRLCFVSPQLFLDFCSPERSPWLPASRKASDRIESQHSSCDLVELPKVYLCPLVRQLSPLSGLTSTWIFTPHLIKGRKSNSGGKKSWHREYYLARHLQISL